jgi:hypothetical protein
MMDASAEKANKRDQKPTDKNATKNLALHRRYGQIGISAVAAAARYQGAAKNPAYAPAPTKLQSGPGETAV